jgi:hypothetical protein
MNTARLSANDSFTHGKLLARGKAIAVPIRVSGELYFRNEHFSSSNAARPLITVLKDHKGRIPPAVEDNLHSHE